MKAATYSKSRDFKAGDTDIPKNHYLKEENMSPDLSKEFQKNLHRSEPTLHHLSHQDSKKRADISSNGAQLPEL